MSVPESPIAGIQVLVVDDMAPIRDLLSNFFQKHNLTVTAVCDGVSAIQTLERNRGKFELVVTDLHMPGADGFAVLAEAKRSNPGCAVVIVTGYASLDSAIQAVRVGAYDYLPKPFKMSEVEELLERIAADRAWRRQEVIEDVVAEISAIVPSVDHLSERVRRIEQRLGVDEEVHSVGFPTRR